MHYAAHDNACTTKKKDQVHYCRLSDSNQSYRSRMPPAVDKSLVPKKRRSRAGCLTCTLDSLFLLITFPLGSGVLT